MAAKVIIATPVSGVLRIRGDSYRDTEEAFMMSDPFAPCIIQFLAREVVQIVIIIWILTEASLIGIDYINSTIGNGIFFLI